MDKSNLMDIMLTHTCPSLIMIENENGKEYSIAIYDLHCKNIWIVFDTVNGIRNEDENQIFFLNHKVIWYGIQNESENSNAMLDKIKKSLPNSIIK